MIQPKGRQGWWFASVGGEAYPCVHSSFISIDTHGHLTYRDPALGRELPEDYVRGIERGEVIVTKTRHVGDNNYARRSYVGRFAVSNVRRKGRELLFDFVKRLESY